MSRRLLGGGEFQTEEGGILFLLSVIGIFYFILKCHPTWAIGIIMIIGFCLGFLCDFLGYKLHKLFLRIKNLIK